MTARQDPWKISTTYAVPYIAVPQGLCVESEIPAICDKLDFVQTLPMTPAGNCAERNATRGAVDHPPRPPHGFAAAVRAGFQRIAQDTSPGRFALNRGARSRRAEYVGLNPNRETLAS
jgi:hypothetical protein